MIFLGNHIFLLSVCSLLYKIATKNIAEFDQLQERNNEQARARRVQGLREVSILVKDV